VFHILIPEVESFSMTFELAIGSHGR